MRNIWRDPKSGKTFHRSRRGGKLVLSQLPDLPHDHPDFIAAWAAARKGTEPPKIVAGSIASTWRAIFASAQAREWSPGYHAIIKRHADAICAKAGQAKAMGVRQVHIRADLDSANDPVNRLKAWRAWGAWCAARGLIAEDMTLTLRNKRRKVTRRPPWTKAHKAAFRARWAIGSVPRALMELTNWTGARACDMVRLGPQMIRPDGVLEYRQSKTGERAYVPWSCPLPKWATHLEPERQMMLQAIAPFAGHLCFVPTNAGKPRSEKAVINLFQRLCRDLDLPVSLHGLRKTRAVESVEGGATSQQGAAWTGHIDMREYDDYAREFDRLKAVSGTPQEPHLDVPEIQLDVRRKST
ncbi:MAG: integrase [Tabrizicola sp.]|uniref:integrase n=1 Tax=Tabrizicola sp. TaxID=2005166 RepID=UPI0027352E13|nr:integrase [Tabrizicola sp.]MDP3262454.1 integrase [Tabrizicola sp.]MDP3648526.1 integrase [Paracoccaceae bacterium]